MPDTPLIDQLTGSLNPAISQGLNDAAVTILQHVRDAVPVRSGALSESYAIVKRATPESLSTTIDSAVPYRFNHYPFTESFGRKPRLGGAARPLLFAPDGATEDGDSIVETAISNRIEEVNG